MYNISNSTGPVGYGETSGEDGSSTDASTGQEFYKNLISKANSVPILSLFKHYGLPVNFVNLKITCPFKSHKGGRESSPSFWVYPATNTYHCFGCKLGRNGVDFVSAMDGITKHKAACKILNLFGKDVIENEGLNKEDFLEQLNLMIDFSNFIREQRLSNCDERFHKHLEYACSVYDKLHLNHKKLDSVAIAEIIRQSKNFIVNYK